MRRIAPLYSAAADGRPEEEDVDRAPRQAPGAARHRGAASERLPEMRPAQASASGVPHVQDVPGPRSRPAPRAGAVACMVRVAVDALGGDRAPDEIVAGALEAASDGIRPILFGPPGLDPGGLELVADRRRRRDAREARGGRSREAGLLARTCRAGQSVHGAGGRGRLGREHGRDARGRAAAHPAPAGCRCGPRSPSRSRPPRAVRADRRGRERRRAPRAPAPVRPHGRGLRRGAPRHREPECGCSRSARSRRRATSSRSRRTSCSPPSGLASPATPRAATCSSGEADVIVSRRLHRQRGAEDARGNDPERDRRAAPRDRRHTARKARRAAHPPGGPPPSRAARSGHVRRRLPARSARPRRHRAWLELTHAVANAIRLAARGVEHDVVERLGERIPERIPERAGVGNEASHGHRGRVGAPRRPAGRRDIDTRRTRGSSGSFP